MSGRDRHSSPGAASSKTDDVVEHVGRRVHLDVHGAPEGDSYRCAVRAGRVIATEHTSQAALDGRRLAGQSDSPSRRPLGWPPVQKYSGGHQSFDRYRARMSEPRPGRPYMPGYGVPSEPDGMLPWSFAEERLTASHDYWLATRWPDGRPHVMPVWGAWFDTSLWFSTDQTSRKARNLATDPRCVVTTDNALEPVILEGVAGADRRPLGGRGLCRRHPEKVLIGVAGGRLYGGLLRRQPRWRRDVPHQSGIRVRAEGERLPNLANALDVLRSAPD